MGRVDDSDSSDLVTLNRTALLSLLEVVPTDGAALCKMLSAAHGPASDYSSSAVLLLGILAAAASGAPLPSPQDLTRAQFGQAQDHQVQNQRQALPEPGANRQHRAVRIFSGYSNVSFPHFQKKKKILFP